jgi:hypothetical protein
MSEEEIRSIEPNNPGFDTAEVNARGVAVFIVVMVVMLVVVIVGVQFYFNSIHEREYFEKVMAPVSDDLRELRAREDGQLGSYGYVNKDAGVVRLPVRRAMELLAKEAADGKLPYPTGDQKVKKEPGQ